MLLAWSASAGVAHADDDHPSWEVQSYDAAVTLDETGLAQVELTLDFDFAGDPGHGPYITLPLRQEIANDPDHWWTFDVDLLGAHSPSGADATVQTTTDNGNLLIRLGSEGRTFSGVQTYVIDYTVKGLIATNQKDSGLDEFNWNIIGQGWEVPIEQANVTVTGPTRISDAACFTGSSFTTPCDQASHDDAQATYAQDSLRQGVGMQIVAGFPAGTFTDAQPVLTKRHTIGNMFPLTPVTGGVTLVLIALGIWQATRLIRRAGRDQIYLGMAPGTMPADPTAATVGYADPKAPVAVAFTPPRGARAGEIGTLIDATADDRDITASLIDLAVRGHLTVEQAGPESWTFTARRSGEPLAPFEQHLLATMFQAGSVVTSEELRDSSYATLASGTRRLLYQRVTNELHWFRRNPQAFRGLAIGAGVLLIVAGALVGFGLGFLGFGLVGLAPIVVGVVVCATSGKYGARTPTGSAVLAQAKGFELYLSTAEADQLRFEEGEDIFSKYLPYAIAFGVAERWTRIFQRLMADGRYQPSGMGWYVGSMYGYGAFLSPSFASSMDSLTHTMSESMMQAATPATSGGSGFSGGGGFGGGGGGGW